MTLDEARKILEAPKFGDPRCLKARQLIEDEAEATALRASLNGKRITCWCCDGKKYLNCAVGCLAKYHPCHTCDGEDYLTLRPRTLADLHLYQLRDIAKEIKVPA